MFESFQKEIPKARVNITLDVDTDGARKKRELPCKLLMLGDFSNGKSSGSVAGRERINIHKDNFNCVMSDLHPELNIMVANKLAETDDLKVELQLDNIKAFEPEQVALQVPELCKLIAMRNLLKDLRACILDNSSFRKELEKIMKNKNSAKALIKELKQHAPLTLEQQ